MADPCGNYIVKKDALAVFIKSVIRGKNCRNKDVVCLATVKNYAVLSEARIVEIKMLFAWPQ